MDEVEKLSQNVAELSRRNVVNEKIVIELRRRVKELHEQNVQLLERINVIQDTQAKLGRATEDFEQALIYQPQEKPDWKELRKAITEMINA